MFASAKPILMACLSRGGSNLVAAALHNNPAIYSVAMRDWRPHASGGRINMCSLGQFTRRTKKSIYFEGGFKKDLGKVRYAAFDKYLEKGMGHPYKSPVILGIVRNPFAVINSLNKVGTKYHFDAWKQDKKKIHKIIRQRFVPMLRHMFSTPGCITIQFEKFTNDPQHYLDKITEFIGVESGPASFKWAFESNGCVYCGGKFTKKRTGTARASHTLTERGLSYPPSDHYYCGRCDKVTLGYGNFNPYMEISCPSGWQSMPANLRKITLKCLVNVFGNEIAAKFHSDSYGLDMLYDWATNG